MSENWSPERLDDSHLWVRYESEVTQLEYWQRRAERTLEELMARGLLTEYPTQTD